MVDNKKAFEMLGRVILLSKLEIYRPHLNAFVIELISCRLQTVRYIEGSECEYQKMLWQSSPGIYLAMFVVMLTMYICTLIRK